MTEGLSFVKSRFGCFLTPLLSNCCFFDVFPLLHCNARRRTNTIHLFAKKCVRRVLNLLSGRLSCPYGVLKLLPYILRRKTQGRCHEVTEGLSPTIENSYVVFPNPYPKKIRNEAVGKRFISKIQVYPYEFSAELKKAIWFYQVAFSLIFLPVCLCFVDSVVRTNLSASTAAQTFVCIDFVDITFRNRFYRTLANARTASHTVVINYVSHCF